METSPSTPPAFERDALVIFSFLWALGALFHHAKFSAWAVTPADLAVTVMAFWVLVRPRSIGLLFALFTAQVWLVAVEMPHSMNSTVISGLVGLIGILVIARRFLISRGGHVDPGEIFRDFAPPARAVFLLLFLFAGFHKLNADWLRPEVSCGAEFHNLLAARLPFVPTAPWAVWSSIIGSLAIELTTPFLLLHRRFRVAGICLAAGFLYLVGIGRFFTFAARSVPLLSLFVPERLWEEMASRCARHPLSARFLALARSSLVHRGTALAAAALTAAAIAVLLMWPWEGVREPLLVRELTTGRRPLLSYGWEVAWWFYGAAVFAVAVVVLPRRRSSLPTGRRLLAHPVPWLALIPLLVFLSGISPYLGLKSESSFAMFSNLRTEAGSNHLLVRRTADLFGFQRDIVRIESSSDRELQQMAERGYLLPYVELRAYVRARARSLGPDFALTYVRDGNRYSVERAGLDRELMRPDPLLVRKLVAFRPVWAGERNPCRH